MSAQKEYGFAPIIALIILVLLAVAGFFLYKNIPSLNLFSQKQKAASEANKPDLKGWQKFNFKYGQININYPQGWLVKYVYQPGSIAQNVDFFPSANKSVITSDYIISLFVDVNAPNTYPVPIQIPDDKQLDSSLGGEMVEVKPDLNQVIPYQEPSNFTIPSLGNKPNAFFDQQSNYTTIRFQRNGVQYSFNADIAKALQQKMDPAEITAILTKIAKSIEFTDEKSSCDDPVLKPINDFPASFTITTNHNSDKTDPVLGYWPNLGKPGQDYYIQQDAQKNSRRIFAADYIKEGQSFKTSADFEKSVVIIEGGYSAYDQDLSAIHFVSCPVDYSKPAVSAYSLSTNQDKPFSISVWASSTNPKKLWGVAKWNIGLLKQTRDTVYVRRGDYWQKYLAKNFYVGF